MNLLNIALLSMFGISASATVSDVTYSVCQGEGKYENVYISSTASFSSGADHVCIGGTDEFESNKRLLRFSLDQGDPGYLYEKMPSLFYAMKSDDRNNIFIQKNYKETSRVRLLDASEAKVVEQQAGKVDRFGSHKELARLTNPEIVTFTCKTVPSYGAPCDSQATELTRKLTSGQLQPLSSQDVADYLADYLKGYLDRGENLESVEALIKSANDQ